MKGIPTEKIPDLINTTLPHFKNRGRFEAAFELQQYYFVDEIFQQDKYSVQDGSSIEWTVVLDENGTARHTGLYATRNRNQKDAVRLGTARWCYADAYAAYEAHELTMNRGASAKAKYIKTKYFGAYKSIANIIERRAVLTPEDANDTENPQGVAWWLSKLPSGTTDYVGGFNGKYAAYADGTTTSVIGGIDAVNEPLWRSYVVNHTGMNINTLESMRKANIFTDFRPPRNVKEMYTGPASKRRVLWGLSFHAEYMRIINQGPDSRNGDYSPFNGDPSVFGVRPVPLPTLEGVAYNPIYCVDFANFKPVVHSDWWMKETSPMNDVDQPHVFIQQIDCQYNYQADNRRSLGYCLHEPIP